MTRHRTIRHFAVAGIAAAFAVVGCGAAANAAAGWQANEDDALLFQMHVGKYRLDNDVRGYRTGDGVCVDLGDVIQALDLPVRLDKKSRRATGWLFSEANTFSIDRDSNTVQIVNKTVSLAPGQIYDTPEGWCTDTAALSQWFGAQFKPDPYNLILTLESAEKLPFIEAIERRSRAARLRPKPAQFDLSTLPQADTPYKEWRTPAVDAVVNFRFDSQPGGTSRTQASYEIYASGEAAGLSYDARLASDQAGAPRSLRLEAYRVDPKGGLLGPLMATKFAIGDIESENGSLAGASAVGRGAIITNRPLVRPSSFSKTTIRGAMPAGWDAELYRNDQLIAFQGSSNDGRYEFPDVDLYFGPNDFEVVLYGPQGQIRRESSSIPVGIESITPGKTNYWVTVFDQGRDLLEFGREIVDPNTGWRWGVGVERGIDDRTMVAAAAQSMVVKGQRFTYFEATLRRAVGPMLVELAAAQSFGHGRAYRAQALGRVGAFNFEAQTLWVDGDYQSDIVEPYVRGQSGFNVNTSLKLGRTRMPVGFAVRQEVWRDGSKVNEWLIRGSVITRNLSLTAELGQQWTVHPGVAEHVGDGLRLDLLANSRIGRFDVRGEARFLLTGPNRGLVSTKLVGETPLSDSSSLRLQAEHFAGYGRTDFTVGYVRQFKRFSLQGEMRVGTDGSFGGALSLAFSIGPNPAHGGIRFSNEKLARTGQAAVTVFLDENGDGVRSPGEKPLADVAVEAGQRPSEGVTDKDGKVIVDGMRPYLPVLISIDTGSLPDPFLQPSGKGVVVTPRPGVATQIELPLAPTGEIEGTVFSVAGTELPGVELELVDGLGQVAAKTMTEYDGYFLFEMVPYGHYSLRVAEKAAKVLGVERGLASQLDVSARNDSQRLGIIKLKKDPAATVAAAEAEAQPKIASAAP